MASETSKRESRQNHDIQMESLGPGDQVWQPLLGSGLLDSATSASQATRRGQEVACAVSVRGNVQSGQAEDLELCLTWDSPQVRFGAGLKEHRRFIHTFIYSIIHSFFQVLHQAVQRAAGRLGAVSLRAGELPGLGETD